MIYINLIIIVLFALLALLSKKHYSKYKDGRKVIGLFVAYWISMGECAWILLENKFHLESWKSKLMDNLRKIQVVPSKKLEPIIREFMAKLLAIALGIIFVFNLLELGLCLRENLLKDGKNVIEREEYSGDIRLEEIGYEIEGQKQTYVLEVSPVRLSREEFCERADIVAKEIEDKYFKQGSLVSQDIELPLTDEDKVFSISWVSDNPEVISARGRLKEDIKDTLHVTLRMTIAYHDYSAEYSYKFKVGTPESSQEEVKKEIIGQALNNLEKENAGEKRFALPQEIEGVKINVKSEESQNGRALLMGVLLSITTSLILVSKIREKVESRDRQLMREYPFFVDSLWLYIQTGMNVKSTLKKYIKDKEESILIKEIKYTLNQIDTGMVEYSAYEELGQRIGIPVYVTLMRHISQNLKMGTKDLRQLMENEVEIVLKTRQENVRKKGEEASTKLVFPMIVLLLVVMVIVMTPAFMSF